MFSTILMPLIIVPDAGHWSRLLFLPVDIIEVVPLCLWRQLSIYYPIRKIKHTLVKLSYLQINAGSKLVNLPSRLTEKVILILGVTYAFLLYKYVVD